MGEEADEVNEEWNKKFDEDFDKMWNTNRTLIWVALTLVAVVLAFLIFVGVRVTLKYT